MSDILIKGMEMPKNCQECALYIDGACYGKGYRDYRSIMDTAKPDDCPLVELPPHGRLIDADKFEFEMNDKLLVALTEKYGEEEAKGGLHFSFRDCISNIQYQPTVIEAEGEYMQ